VWQARVYAATAARLAKDSSTLAMLARDGEPNVAAEAMETPDDALRALSSDHAGLLIAAARKLRGTSQLAGNAATLRNAFDRLARMRRVTMRDARVPLLERIGEIPDGAPVEWLSPYLNDPDPDIAALASRILTARTQSKVDPVTTRYYPPADRAVIAGPTRDVTARITIRDRGSFTVRLMADDAPVTAAAFVELASRKKYDGLTFHRMVPNFVIQGGSPGADEYDPLTDYFMRDEVGARNLRGTLGVSTRGHDTGDGQIYVNLIDNFRLDYTYTVFARVIEGMDVVDSILEGDVIESIVVRR
jgi:cyclophilin family peptidyl-prolyl cis-trans isomerase